MGVIKDANDPDEVTTGSEKSSRAGKDPIEEALAVKKKLMGDEILSAELTKQKAEKVEAETRLAKAQAEAKRAEAGGDEPSKSGFKTTGEIKMGVIDLQADRAQAIQELRDLKKEQEEGMKSVGQENQQLRDKIHEQEMKVLQISFQSQMEMMTKMIESNASRGSFADQLNAARETAKELGYSQSPNTAGDLMAQIELKKLEFNQQLEFRKWTREEKRADREFQRQLRKDDEDRETSRAEFTLKQKNQEMIAKAPEVIGGAIAKGIIASQGEAGSQAAQGAKSSGYLEANWGDAGEAECPSCGSPIAVGPTARSAVCANCGTKIPIKRVGEKPTAQAEEE